MQPAWKNRNSNQQYCLHIKKLQYFLKKKPSATKHSPHLMFIKPKEMKYDAGFRSRRSVQNVRETQDRTSSTHTNGFICSMTKGTRRGHYKTCGILSRNIIIVSQYHYYLINDC